MPRFTKVPRPYGDPYRMRHGVMFVSGTEVRTNGWSPSFTLVNRSGVKSVPVPRLKAVPVPQSLEGRTGTASFSGDEKYMWAQLTFIAGEDRNSYSYSLWMGIGPNGWFSDSDGPDSPQVSAELPELSHGDGAASTTGDAAIDDALLETDSPGALVRLGKAPALLDSAGVRVWDGRRWASSAFEFGAINSLARAQSGALLVAAANGSFWLRGGGEAPLTAYRLETGAGALRQVGKEVWLFAKNIWIPEDPAALRAVASVGSYVPWAQRRTPVVPAAKPEEPTAQAGRAGTGPDGAAGSAPAAPSAAPSSAPEPPGPGAFYASCKAPFAILATPPTQWHQYTATLDALRGHGELQREVAFYEFLRKGVVYFGAQAKTEQAARRVIELFKAKYPTSRPQLGCFDAARLVPDRYSPPAHTRQLLINLATGTELPI